MTPPQIQIDALTICYVGDLAHLDFIKLNDLAHLDCFTLHRIEGRYRAYVFQILYRSEDGEIKPLGTLKYDKPTSTNPEPFAWIVAENKRLYDDEWWRIASVARLLGLKFHNITTLDLAFDTTRSTSTLLRALIRRKDITTILNGKVLRDRKKDRPEIVYTYTGNLDRLKYLTINVKQQKAIHDKTAGATLITYNKAAEIRNGSGKAYILEHYGNPQRLYRTEVHLNKKQIDTYEKATAKRFGYIELENDTVLRDLFFCYANSLIHFRLGRKIISWQDILEKPKKCVLGGI